MQVNVRGLQEKKGLINLRQGEQHSSWPLMRHTDNICSWCLQSTTLPEWLRTTETVPVCLFPDCWHNCFNLKSLNTSPWPVCLVLLLPKQALGFEGGCEQRLCTVTVVPLGAALSKWSNFSLQQGCRTQGQTQNLNWQLSYRERSSVWGDFRSLGKKWNGDGQWSAAISEEASCICSFHVSQNLKSIPHLVPCYYINPQIGKYKHILSK